MNGYLIARLDITDSDAARAAYTKYLELAAPAYAEHGARFLARGGEAFPLEGDGRARNVVIEFPSVADALACYKSDTYQSARKLRLPAAEGEIVIVEGAVKARPAQEGKKGYWISRQDIHNQAPVKKYIEGSAAPFEEFGALFLVRGGPQQAMEGQARERNVLIEFPSLRHALDCFHSDAYQAASEQRRAGSVGEILVVEGA